MACNCRNEDGTLSNKCYGICKKDVIIEQEMQQQRDPLNGFSELIMSQVDKLISHRLIELKVSLMKEHKEIEREEFMKGLKEGLELGRQVYGADY